MLEQSQRNAVRRILAADMWPCFGWDDPNHRRQKFLETGGPAFSNLIGSLLLYDEVLIPTQDYMVINILVGVLGEAGLIDCIETGAIRFVRIRGSLGYAGSGGAVHGPCVVSMGLTGNGKSHDDKHLDPYSIAMDESIDWSFSGLPVTPNSDLAKQAVLKASAEIELDSIIETSVEETKRDLQMSALSQRFASRSISEGHLPGVTPRDIRIFQSAQFKTTPDDIDLLLDVVRVNLEFALTNAMKCDDCSTVAPILDVLIAKEERTQKQRRLDCFFDLHEIADVPDIGRGISERRLSINDVLKLRRSSGGIKFRQWFHQNAFQQPHEVARAFIDILRTQPRVDSIPVRILRYLATAVVGVLDPVTGMIVGAADSFLVSPIFARNRVKLFVDRLRNLAARSE